MNPNHRFDSEFRRRAREIKTKPSAEVWSRLENNRAPAKRISIFHLASIAAGLLILVGAITMFAPTDTEFNNPNYQLSEVSTEELTDYNEALMEWIDSNGH